MHYNIDICKLKNQKHFENDKDMYDFIRKSFPGIETVPVKGSYFSFAFSFFSHICHPLSINSLAAATGPFVSSKASRVKVNRLANRGALKTLNFKEHSDRGAVHAYYLSPAGVDGLFHSLPPELCVKNKARRTGGVVPLHEYGVGLSLLQCMLREVPFSYNKESCYSSASFKQKGTLCVDAVVFFQDRQQSILYIEQDMGTEPPSTLVKKLVSYERYGLTVGANRHLVISSHAAYNFFSCLSFNCAALNELKTDMEGRGANNVYEYYKAHNKELTERLLLTVKALLVRTGICNCYHTNSSPVVPHEVTAEHKLFRNDSTPDLSISDLEEYMRSISEGTNIYKTIDYNTRQLRVSHGKLASMADIIIRRISLGQFEMDEVRSLLGGFSCHVVPSVLLSNYFERIFSSNVSELRRCLSAYHSDIMDAPYSEFSESYMYRGAVSVRFRNCFKLSDGSSVCIEYVGTDLGGYIRGYLLRMMQIAGSVENIHLVCVFDTEQEAMEYAAVIDYYRKGRDLDFGQIMISFMLAEDIGMENALRVPSRLAGGGLVRIKPLHPICTHASSSVDLSAELDGLSISELSKMLQS